MKKKMIGIFICMSLLITVLSVATVSVVADDWPMMYHDAMNTCASSSPALESAGIKWDKDIGTSYFSSVVADGKVYVKANYGMLYCFDALTGNEEWSDDTGFSGCKSLMVYNDRIYIEHQASVVNGVRCFDASNGNLLWSKNIGSDITAADGRLYTIYQGSGGKQRLDCRDASTGNLIWNTSYLMDEQNLVYRVELFGPPAVLDDYVYIGGDSTYSPSGGVIYCFDATPDDNGDGVVNESDDEGIDDPNSIEFDLVWRCITEYPIKSPPSVADFGEVTITYTNITTGGIETTIENRTRVYFTTEDGKVYCLDANPDDNGDGFHEGPHYGAFVWPLDGNFYMEPVDPNRVWLGLDVNEGMTGEGLNFDLIWTYDEIEGSELPSSLAVANNNIYVNIDGLYCLDAAGNETADPPYSTTTLVWSKTSGASYSDPILVGGELYTTITGEGLAYFDALDGAEIFSTDLDATVQCVGDNGYIYGSMGSKLVCIGENNAPSAPDQPDGSTDGYIEVEYTFSTNLVSDPDGDDVFYKFDWGDGTDSGWTSSPTASHIWDSEETYEVKVKAKDSYGVESDWSPTLTVTISIGPPEPILVINVDSTTYIEGDPITVVVKDSTGATVVGADVLFNGETKQIVDSTGVIFTAPQVDTDTEYTITAQDEDYDDPVSTSITILDKPGQENGETDEGWIWGTVIDDSGSVIQDVEICISTEGTIPQCVFTDEYGVYMSPSLPVGIYTVKASKDRYETETVEGVEVKLREAITVDFTLEEGPGETSDEPAYPIDYVIKNEKEKGTVFGKIALDESEGAIITTYNKDYDIQVISATEKEFSCTVSGPEGAVGKIITARFGPGTLEDMENVKVEYDNEPISWVDFDTIFDSDQEDTDATAKWTSVLAIDENGEQILYILVYTHFSEHTITISSIIEAVGGITMMFLYAAFCVIAVIVFLIRIFINPVYLDYLKEKKE